MADPENGRRFLRVIVAGSYLGLRFNASWSVESDRAVDGGLRFARVHPPILIGFGVTAQRRMAIGRPRRQAEPLFIEPL